MVEAEPACLLSCRAMKPPQEVSSALLPYQEFPVRALMTHQDEGSVSLLAWLQGSDSARHDSKSTAGSDLVGRWRLESGSGGLLRLSFVDSLPLSGCMQCVASCSSTNLIAVFGGVPA